MIVFPIPPGQLGNQLFCIAHLAAASMETGVNCSFPCFGYPLAAFPNINTDKRLRVAHRSTRETRLASFVHRAVRRLCPASRWHACLTNHEPPFLDLASSEIASLAIRKHVYCEGFGFRAIKALERHRESVTRLLEFSSEIRNRAEAFIARSIRDHDTVLFGFHIRRGDYRTYRGGEYFFTNEHWQNWVQQCRQISEQTGKRFLGIAFSNEPLDWLVDHQQDVIAGPGDLFDDLAVLSMCHYLVGPPSTFSGWASFMGRKPLLVLDRAELQCHVEQFQVVNW